MLIVKNFKCQILAKKECQALYSIRELFNVSKVWQLKPQFKGLEGLKLLHVPQIEVVRLCLTLNMLISDASFPLIASILSLTSNKRDHTFTFKDVHAFFLQFSPQHVPRQFSFIFLQNNSANQQQQLAVIAETCLFWFSLLLRDCRKFIISKAKMPD